MISLALWGGLWGCPCALATPPNVILMITDDQGYGDMACHGNPWLKTPNLDRLHAESVCLENYHVDPVCTPTRAALMTGRYCTRVGAWTVTEGRQLLNANEKTMGDGFNAGMRGKKGSVYEGGHRVACFVRWPARFSAGRKVTQLTAHLDWLPTLIELCGLKAPAGVKFDGHSIAPLLDGNATSWPERTLFVDRQTDQLVQASLAARANAWALPQFAVLTRQWRLVNGELYDIAADPGQKQNIAAPHPEVVNRLFAAYTAWFKDVANHRGAYTPFRIGASEENPTTFTARDWHPTEGKVIWRPEQLADDTLFINGFWAVEIVRSGRYAIRLSRYPPDAEKPMGASAARIKLGDIEQTRTFAPETCSVTFALDLKSGPAIVQTWLKDAQTGRERGAYHVRAEEETSQKP